MTPAESTDRWRAAGWDLLPFVEGESFITALFTKSGRNIWPSIGAISAAMTGQPIADNESDGGRAQNRRVRLACVR